MASLMEWRNNVIKNNKSYKHYAHFDSRTDINRCWDYIIDPQNIVKHNFYPFIEQTQKLTKFSPKQYIKKHGEDIDIKDARKPKVRDICYAAHIDRCIYQLYGYYLNEYYNAECKKRGIHDVSAAYRTNLNKKNNMDFAYRAINFIKSTPDCHIMIGDFSAFFDNLDHGYLKKQWCAVINQQRLPDDHYAVFKNITKFSKIKLKDIQKHYSTEPTHLISVSQLNKKKRIANTRDFKMFKKKLIRNTEKGIPQGSPLSGVLANIYMLDADSYIKALADEYHGLYIRYSDDFIIALPISDTKTAKEVFERVSQYLNNPQTIKLTLQPEKTQYYRYTAKSPEGGKIENCGKSINEDADCTNQYMNYLGFTFNGREAFIRDKTVSKYYYRMYKKVNNIVKSKGHVTVYDKKTNKPIKKRITKKNLYTLYSIKGANSERGNFFTYLYECLKPGRFEHENRIRTPIRRHMGKIKKALKGY